MTFVDSFILGVIEGITEFLPISSTAHLEIGSKILGVGGTDFFKSFEIIIQLGAILAVVVLYRNVLKKNWELWKRILVAFFPTGVIGFVLYKFIKEYALGNEILTICTLGIGGIIIIVFEFIYKDSNRLIDSTSELESMPYSVAFFIGIAQALAVIPGVSRSAATIIAGRMLGISGKAIVEFSFLLAIPTMLAATGYDIFKNAASFSRSDISLLSIGFITAFFAALCAVTFFIKFVQKKGLTLFGLYRILLAFILIWFTL